MGSRVKEIICVCCPSGCSMSVSLTDAGEVSEVRDNRCVRGYEYAIKEMTAPERVVTAVLPIEGCLEPLSVKTAAPVPKQLIFDVLAAIEGLELKVPIEMGEQVIADVCGTGVAVVATKSLRG